MPNLNPEERENFEHFLKHLNEGNNQTGDPREYILSVAADIWGYCGPNVDLPRHMDFLRDWYDDVWEEDNKAEEENETGAEFDSVTEDDMK